AVLPTSPSLESMPAEIKLGILRLLPDFKDLRALAHASPDYYQSYLLARDDVLTNVTLTELKARNIDILTPVQFAEVCVRGGEEPDANLQPAIKKIYRQIASDSPIKLSTDQCLALRSLVDFKGYCAELPPPNIFPIWALHRHQKYFTCLTHNRDSQYLDRYGWRSYNVFVFGRQNDTARAWMDHQLKEAHIVYGRAESNKRIANARRIEALKTMEQETDRENASSLLWSSGCSLM
ncbi:MAG: hypothetical protein Q9181_008076, partial [Wetmoreana brouardii]